MADGGRSRRSSSGSWLCSCVRPAVEDAEAVSPVTPTNKVGPSQSTHVTAIAHTGMVADAAPAGRDQVKAAAQPGPGGAVSPRSAAAAAAGVNGAQISTHSKPDHQVVVRHTHHDLKHLMASSHERLYTDADWDACLAALEQVKKHNQALALQQLQNGHNRALHRNSFASAASDTWHDAVSHTMSDASAVSEADHRELELYLAELQMLRGPAPELCCTPTCEPNPPLLFAPKHWKYCQVEPHPFCAYWERDSVRSTPFPLPIDRQQKLNKLAMMCHASIPGMWMRMEGNQLVLTASPTIIAIPGMMNYHEYYNTDSTLANWTLRRDIQLGRSQGQMFMTTDGILIFRVFCMGVFSKTVDCILEDYMRVEDNGNVIITKQWSKLAGSDTVASQYLVGRKTGPDPPSAKQKH